MCRYIPPQLEIPREIPTQDFRKRPELHTPPSSLTIPLAGEKIRLQTCFPTVSLGGTKTNDTGNLDVDICGT